jgi:hypothetical protein
MANITGNPWSFLTTDQATSAAIATITRQGIGSALITTTGAHGLTGNPLISVQGSSPTGWNRGYRVDAIPSTTTLVVPITDPMAGLANASTGTVYTAAYLQLIEVTQMLWDGPTAADVLSITDASGRLVWNPTAVTGGSYTYMKCFPIVGLVINAIPSGKLQISV